MELTWKCMGHFTDLRGFPWKSMKFHEVPWNLMGLFYTAPSLYILIKFNYREVEWKWRIFLSYKSECNVEETKKQNKAKHAFYCFEKSLIHSCLGINLMFQNCSRLFVLTCHVLGKHGSSYWGEIISKMMWRENWFEIAGGSSYRGFELLRVTLQ